MSAGFWFGMIGFTVLVIVFVVSIVIRIRDKYKPFEFEDEEHNENKKRTTEVPMISIALYDDIVDLFKQTNQVIASIREINTLISQNAEVRASILNEKDFNYVSMEHLYTWYESYKSQLILKYCLLKDIYSNSRLGLPKQSRQFFDMEFYKIEKFINTDMNINKE